MIGVTNVERAFEVKIPAFAGMTGGARGFRVGEAGMTGGARGFRVGAGMTNFDSIQ